MQPERGTTRASPSKRFSVSDVVVLTAATALGLCWYTSVDHEVVLAHLKGALPEKLDARWVTTTLAADVWFCWPMAFVWSLAGLFLRLCRPRPRLRHLMRQPGFVAYCSVAVVGLLLVFPMLVADAALDFASPLSPWEHLTFDWENANAVGLTVAVGWIVSWLSGRWRPEPSWIDRMGRIFGVYWITMVPAYLWLCLSNMY
jgi:hypothetical protein